MLNSRVVESANFSDAANPFFIHFFGDFQKYCPMIFLFNLEAVGQELKANSQRLLETRLNNFPSAEYAHWTVPKKTANIFGLNGNNNVQAGIFKKCMKIPIASSKKAGSKMKVTRFSAASERR